MKHFKLIAALLAVSLLGSFAPSHSATVTVTWVNPTQNMDNSAIPATGVGSLASARIEYGSCDGTAFGTKAGEVLRPMPATTAVLNLQPGTTCVRVSVTNTYGYESAPSNVASRVVDPPTPKPPVLAVAVVAGVDVSPVFTVTASGARSSTVGGLVAVGTPCEGPVLFEYRGKQWRTPAQWMPWRTPATARVAAPCA